MRMDDFVVPLVAVHSNPVVEVLLHPDNSAVAVVFRFFRRHASHRDVLLYEYLTKTFPHSLQMASTFMGCYSSLGAASPIASHGGIRRCRCGRAFRRK